MDGSNFCLNKIGMVMLGVRNLARSVEFYRDRLGLKVTSATEGFAFLDSGGATLCLSQPLGRGAERLDGATEVVFSVDGVREAFQALRQKGVEFFQEPRNVTGTMWAANFRDPDGHGLSIFGPERKA